MSQTQPTIKTLIEEKKTNFAKFLRESFKSPDFDPHIQIIENMDAKDFVMYVNQYVKCHRSDNYNGFILGLCKQHNLDESKDETVTIINKCKRYLDLFTTIC